MKKIGNSSTGLWRQIRTWVNNLFLARFSRRECYALLALFVLLVSLRALLPVGVQWYVNRQLDASFFYEGSIGDVDLSLIQGAYRVEDITIAKLAGEVPAPLFSAKSVDFSLRWNRLIHGEVVAEITFKQAIINFIDSKQDSGDQTGENENWVSLLDNLVPVQIDLVTVEDSELHFRNFDAEANVDVFIKQFNGSAENLSNRPRPDTSLPSSIRGSGTLMNSGDLHFQGQFDFARRDPAFNMDARLRNMPIIELDALIKTYAPFDVESGNLSLTTELAASNGEITGYLKPLINDMEVFEWKEDALEDKDNPLFLLWEALVDTVAELLENQPRNSLASIVPVSGRLDNPDTDSWAAFVNILKNAFVEALNADFEDTVSPEAATSESINNNSGERPVDTEDDGKLPF